MLTREDVYNLTCSRRYFGAHEACNGLVFAVNFADLHHATGPVFSSPCIKRRSPVHIQGPALWRSTRIEPIYHLFDYSFVAYPCPILYCFQVHLCWWSGGDPGLAHTNLCAIQVTSLQSDVQSSLASLDGSTQNCPKAFKCTVA